MVARNRLRGVGDLKKVSEFHAAVLITVHLVYSLPLLHRFLRVEANVKERKEIRVDFCRQQPKKGRPFCSSYPSALSPFLLAHPSVYLSMLLPTKCHSVFGSHPCCIRPRRKMSLRARSSTLGLSVILTILMTFVSTVPLCMYAESVTLSFFTQWITFKIQLSKDSLIFSIFHDSCCNIILLLF